MGYVPSLRKKKKSMQSQCKGIASNLQKDTRRWVVVLGGVEESQGRDMIWPVRKTLGRAMGRLGLDPACPALCWLGWQPHCPAVAPPTRAHGIMAKIIIYHENSSTLGHRIILLCIVNQQNNQHNNVFDKPINKLKCTNLWIIGFPVYLHLHINSFTTKKKSAHYILCSGTLAVNAHWKIIEIQNMNCPHSHDQLTMEANIDI